MYRYCIDVDVGDTADMIQRYSRYNTEADTADTKLAHSTIFVQAINEMPKIEPM